jgi:trigger factor
MSTDELEREGGPAVSVGEEPRPDEAAPEEAKRKLAIAVEITDAGPCKKHLRVSIPREEIDRQFDESLEALRKDAVVPGFRPGKAPRQVFVKRFKKQVSDQVKTSLLASSLQQIDQEHQLDPISQPRLDMAAIELPDEGPMTFEMDVEVRPQFELPRYQGLSLRRPVWTITDAAVEA